MNSDCHYSIPTCTYRVGTLRYSVGIIGTIPAGTTVGIVLPRAIRRRPCGVALDAVPNLMVEYINEGFSVTIGSKTPANAYIQDQ